MGASIAQVGTRADKINHGYLAAHIPLQITETTLEIGTPKQIIKEWLESRYLPIITSTVHYITNKPLHVVLVNLDNEESSRAALCPLNPASGRFSKEEFSKTEKPPPVSRYEPQASTNSY